MTNIQSLVGLNLDGCGLESECTHLCVSLQQDHLPSLMYLNLCNNYLGRKEILVLSTVLSVNTTLRSLILKANYIDDMAAGSLVMYIIKNTNLLELDVSHNILDHDGIKILKRYWKEKGNRDIGRLQLHDQSK